MNTSTRFRNHKTPLLFLALFGLFLSGGAQNTNKPAKPAFPKIETFFPKMKSWESSLKKAKEANKLLFVDCYTDWCYWCVVMDKKTFRDSSVSTKMQSFMDCYSLEMEQDSLGRLLRFHYGVSGFPTFLIFNGDGNLLFTYRGYAEKAVWLKEMDSIHNIIKTDGFKGKYARPGFPKISPSNIPDWFAPFINSKDYSMFKDTTTSGFSAKYSQLTDVFQLFAVGCLSQYNFNKDNVKLWMEHVEQFDSLFGHDLVRSFTEQIWGSQVYKSINAGNKTDFENNLRELLKWTEYPEFQNYSNWMNWHKTQKDWASYVQLFDANCIKTANSKFATRALDYNQTAWTLFKETEDVALLKKALAYSNKSIEMAPEATFYNTKANLEFKLKDYKSAEASAVKSIEMGTTAKEDTQKSAALLKEIQAAQEASKSVKK